MTVIIRLTFYFLVLLSITACDTPSALPELAQKTEDKIDQKVVSQDQFTVEALDQQQQLQLVKISELEAMLAKSQDKISTLSIELDEKRLDMSKQKEMMTAVQADKQDLQSQLTDNQIKIKTLETALTTLESDCKAGE